MILAIIAGIVCLAVGTVMYTPRMRSFAFYRQTAFLFLFEGIWLLLDYIFRQALPDNVFMQAIHYIGLIVLGIYFVAGGMMSGKKLPKKPLKKPNQK